MLEPTLVEVLLVLSVAFVLNRFLVRWNKFKTTPLDGPPNETFAFGVLKKLGRSSDPGAIFEAWAKRFGDVYTIFGPLGTKRIVLHDPKAISHICSADTTIYSQPPFSIREFGIIIGERTIICLQGHDHKITRKVLNPAFGSTSIKTYFPIFLDAAHKVTAAWEAKLHEMKTTQGNIDISDWMEKVALDVIGLAGFDYDFGSLVGKESALYDVLRGLSTTPPSSLNIAAILLAQVYPWLFKLPLPRSVLTHKLSQCMDELSEMMLERARKAGAEEKSTLGLLLRSEDTTLTKADVITQMKSILFAGNETTAVTLKWAILELARNPEKQDRLRQELSILNNNDPTYDDLNNLNGFPYLDAVVKEILRIHPFGEICRWTVENDIVPLAQPIKMKNGVETKTLSVAAGTMMVMPIHSINRSEAIWGSDAKEFIPERWLTEGGIPESAQRFSGYYHSLTFFDGPRTCLGKLFALIELKAVICILVQKFKFLPHNGPDTQYSTEPRIVGHPIAAGEGKNWLPMNITSLSNSI